MNKPGPLTGELAKALHGDMVPKFLATLDETGKPNLVPVTSLDAGDSATLFFGQFLLWKTRRNLLSNPRVAVMVMTEDLSVWLLRGKFREFVTGGELVERMNEKPLFRYNAYLRISQVGLIDVEELVAAFRISTVDVMMTLAPAWAISQIIGVLDQRKLSPRIRDKFARTKALKALAVKDQSGYPAIFPALSLWPTDGDLMTFCRSPGSYCPKLEKTAQIAGVVLTAEPIAYQIKGTYEGGDPLGLVGVIRVRESYSASPPLPGAAIPLR